MMAEIAAIGLALTAIGALLAMRRVRHYRRLSATLEKGFAASSLRSIALPAHDVPSFAQKIVTIPQFLPQDRLETLRREVESLTGVERSYVPVHKKGGTIAYETIIARAPAIASFYHAPSVQELISRIVGVEVGPTPLHDQSSLSVLVYDRPGDHIGWHYDHNFYRGRHFTALLPVVNRGSAPAGFSHARLTARVDDKETEITAEPNTLVLFEGAEVLHKVSPIIAGEHRVVISMTFCADPSERWWQAIARRVKDMAFFGPRALWT